MRTGKISGGDYGAFLRLPGRTKVLIAAAATLASLAFSAAPAVAAAPETPEVAVEAHVPSPASPSTEAVFHGVLNPGGGGEPGTYEFLYNEGIACDGGSVAPQSPGIALPGRQEISQTVTGLKAGSTYTVCLLARTGTKKEPAQETLSLPVTFTTATPAEKPETEPATGETTSTATLHGVMNPGVAVTDRYYFEYGATGTCVGGSRTEEREVTEAEGAAVAVSALPEGLEANQTYKACLVAINTAGETTMGNEVSFMTAPAPPRIDSEGSSEAKDTSAKLEAQINPNNETTSYTFEYSTEGEVGGALKGTIVTISGASTLTGGSDQTASVPTQVLAPGKTYYYRVVAENAQSKTEPTPAEGTVQSFMTAPLGPPTVDGESVSNVTPSGATLEAQVNPDSQEIKYRFEYSTSPALAGATVIAGGELKEYGDQTASASTGPALTVGVTYYYRVVVENDPRTETIDGPIQAFTPQGEPLVLSTLAQNVTSDTAELSGTVNPAGSQTRFYYAYVEQAVYDEALARGARNPYAPGWRTPASTIPAGFAPQPAGPVTLDELTPGTTYDYALIASSSPTTSTRGPTETFTTSPPAPGSTPAPGTEKTTTTTAGTTAPALPAVVPFASITELNAREAAEQKTIPNPTGGETPTTTRAQKLTKALKACRTKDKAKRRQRETCEKAAHKRYGPLSKARKTRGKT